MVDIPVNHMIKLIIFLCNQPIRDRKFLPKIPARELLALTACGLADGSICNYAVDFIDGISENELNSVS